MDKCYRSILCFFMGWGSLLACTSDPVGEDLAYIDGLAPALEYRATEAERAFGQKLFRYILENYAAYGQEIVGTEPGLASIRVIQNSELNAFVRGVLDDLPGGALYAVILLDVSEIVQFATPDGMVGLSVGALQRTRNRHELAGLIAHELSAVKRGLLAAVVEPTLVPTEKDLGLAADILLAKGFAREIQLTLDIDTYQALIAGGFEPDEYLRLLERWSMEQANDDYRILNATHPPLSQRIATLRAWKVKHKIQDGRDIPESPQLLKFWQQILR